MIGLCTEMLDKNSPALVLSFLVVFPLSLDILVRLEFRVGFHFCDPEFVENTVCILFIRMAFTPLPWYSDRTATRYRSARSFFLSALRR